MAAVAAATIWFRLLQSWSGGRFHCLEEVELTVRFECARSVSPGWPEVRVERGPMRSSTPMMYETSALNR